MLLSLFIIQSHLVIQAIYTIGNQKNKKKRDTKNGAIDERATRLRS